MFIGQSPFSDEMDEQTDLTEARKICSTTLGPIMLHAFSGQPLSVSKFMQQIVAQYVGLYPV